MFSWVSLLMPYVEEASLHSQVNWKIPLDDRNSLTPPDTSHHIQFQTYLCPSDKRVGITNSWYGARGNYAGNVGIGIIWMNDTSPTQDCAQCLPKSWLRLHQHHWLSPWIQTNPEVESSSLSRFGTFMVNKGRKMSEFNDGTSKTAAISEVRNVEGEDTRGVLHFGAACSTCTIFRQTIPALTVKEKTRYCLNVDFAPCVNIVADWKGDWRHFARSNHSGGVNLMMADTSTRFVADSINIDLWKALATPKGDETISEDF